MAATAMYSLATDMDIYGVMRKKKTATGEIVKINVGKRERSMQSPPLKQTRTRHNIINNNVNNTNSSDVIINLSTFNSKPTDPASSDVAITETPPSAVENYVNINTLTSQPKSRESEKMAASVAPPNGKSPVPRPRPRILLPAEAGQHQQCDGIRVGAPQGTEGAQTRIRTHIPGRNSTNRWSSASYGGSPTRIITQLNTVFPPDPTRAGSAIPSTDDINMDPNPDIPEFLDLLDTVQLPVTYDSLCFSQGNRLSCSDDLDSFDSGSTNGEVSRGTLARFANSPGVADVGVQADIRGGCGEIRQVALRWVGIAALLGVVALVVVSILHYTTAPNGGAVSSNNPTPASITTTTNDFTPEGAAIANYSTQDGAAIANYSTSDGAATAKYSTPDGVASETAFKGATEQTTLSSPSSSLSQQQQEVATTGQSTTGTAIWTDSQSVAPARGPHTTRIAARISGGTTVILQDPSPGRVTEDTPNSSTLATEGLLTLTQVSDKGLPSEGGTRAPQAPVSLLPSAPPASPTTGTSSLAVPSDPGPLPGTPHLKITWQ